MRVLVVAEDQAVQSCLMRLPIWSRLGYGEVRQLPCADAGCKAVAQVEPDLVIGCERAPFWSEIRSWEGGRLVADIAFVMLGRAESFRVAFRAGAVGLIVEPLAEEDIEELQDIARRVAYASAGRQNAPPEGGVGAFDLSGSTYAARIKAYIDVHYADDDVSVAQIANSLGLSAVYVGALFRKGVGVCLKEYIRSVRIQRAIGILADERLTIAEVGLRVGYPDRKYFTRVFAQYAGMPPSEFRERCILPVDLKEHH